MLNCKALQLGVICAMVGLVTTPVLADNLTLTLNANDYKVVKSDDGRQVIKMEDFGSLLVPGKPTLPAKVFMIALPPGAEVMSVTVTGMNPMELPGTYRIRPAPPILPMDNEKELVEELMREWRENKDATYSSDQIYPDEVGEYLGTGGLRKYTFARVRFCPFAYRPVSEKLLFYPSATVSIDYTLPAPGSLRDLEAERLLLDVKGEEEASRWLVNYSEAKSWYTLTAKRTAPQTTYDYVIITTEDLQSSVSSLVNWKQAIGYSVNVVTTAWINSSYSGFDLAEKIRNFLIDKYPEWGIEYVLLVGDIDDVPMRRCYPKSNDPVEDTPTDHYYADLTGNWNSDGDSYYGEYEEDNVDVVPEVYVGRIPWNDPSTVVSICQKLVNFEADTGPWKNRALLLGAVLDYQNECDMGGNGTCGCTLMEEMITDMLSGWTYHTMYEKEGLSPCTTSCTAPLSHTNVLNYWSTGQYGIVNWYAHGNRFASSRMIWASDDGDGIPETGGENCPPNEMSWEVFIHKDDAASLDDSHPSIIFGCSCNNGNPDHANLARELLKHGSAGIVAATWKPSYMMDWWDETGRGCASNDYFFFHYLINQEEQVGNALFDSKLYVFNNLAVGSWTDYKNAYTFCLYGDPSLRREGVEVFPDIQLSATSHNFEDVPVGGSQDWTLTISNVGPVNLLIDALDFNHPDFGVKESLGDYAYVAADNVSGLQILDISDPTSPSLAGAYDTPGNARHVTVIGNYAYVADGGYGLQIIDVSNRASPTLAGSYDTPCCASGVAVVGDYAFVANDETGLLIINISNPTSPYLVGSYDTPGNASCVAMAGDYAYIADRESGLQIIDISDPTSPILAGSYETPDWAYEVAVAGDYAYVADFFSGLQIIDISDPTSPSLAGSCNTPGQALGVAVAEEHAYVAANLSGLQIIDISDPALPSLVGGCDTPGFALSVAVAGNYAYVADREFGLQIIDISDRTSPALVGCYETPDWANGVAVPGLFPQTVLPGGHLNVTVAFTPSLTGTKSGQLTVYSDDPDEPTLTVSVTGKGVAPDIHVTPATFDEILVEGGMKTTELTIDNRGNYELTFQITEAIDWLELDPFSGTVEPDGDQSIEMTFDATALSAGEYTGEMTIESNDPFNPVTAIAVSLKVEAIRVIVGVPTTSALPGDIAHVPVEVDNQTWLAVPIASIDAEIGFDENILEFIDVTPSEGTQSMSTFEWSTLSPGSIALSIYDTTGNVIEPGTGPVAEMSFVVSETATSGDCTMISILEAVLTDEGGDTVAVEPVGGMVCFGMRGDVNADMRVNIVDALLAVNILLEIMIPTDLEYWAADCNGDGVVNVLDVLGIVNVVLGIGECGTGACKCEVTPAIMDFLKSLEPHLTARDFTRLMDLVKGMQAQVEIEVPTRYSLSQNYPNPFNPTTSIQYSVVSDQSTPHVTLKIYNLLGQEVRTLVDEAHEPGHYTVTWDGKYGGGRQAVSGIYFYRLTAGDFMATKRMVLMK